MDLSIKDKHAIVCASSKGLGKACATSLAREGVHVIVNGRNPDTVEQTVNEIRKVASGDVTGVACDVTTAAGRDALLAACPNPDILVNNAGGPPPGDFRQWDETHWQAAVNGNMITPILLIKSTIDGMAERGFGRIINITSSAVKAPIPTLGLSNGARTGLTGFVAGLARQVVQNGVTINNILPGQFETDRLTATTHSRAKQAGISFDEQFESGKNANPAKRYGNPEEFGELCAYLCSKQAGYINGQNIIIDGGNFPGTM